MSLDKRNVLKLAKTIYDEYYDFSNIFEICCIEKTTFKTSEIISVYNINAGFVSAKTCVIETEDFKCFSYHNLSDLLKDILYYKYKHFTEINVEELEKKINALNDDEMIMLHYNMDFCDIRVFKNDDEIKQYKDEYFDFED